MSISKNKDKKSHKIRLGLKGKTVIGLGVLSLVALLVMGGATYYQGMTLAINEVLELTRKDIEKDVIEIENFVKNSHDDLQVISDMPPIEGIIRARDNGGIDPLIGIKADFWYTRLEQIFGAFLKYHPEYYRLRYLDEKGDELVRADLIGNAVKITPRKELQRKAQYPYFTETMKLKDDEIYYSEVNLNREQGAIQIPHMPVFRIATPVFDAQNKARGVVVIDVLAEAMFSNIRTTIGKAKKYVVNQDGYLLVHPDRSKEFGFDLGFEYTAKNVMHESEDDMKALDSLVKYHKQDRHVDGFKKIFFDPKNKSRYWSLFYVIPEKVALKNVYLTRNTMLVVGFIVVVFSLMIIIWIFTRKVVSPILILAEAIKKVEGGDFSVRLSAKDVKDEFRDLYQNFNAATASQQNAVERFEHELAKRTSALEKLAMEHLALFGASRSILELKGFDAIARSIFDSCKKTIGATAGYVAVLSKDETQNEVLFLDADGLPCTVDRSLPMPIRGLREKAYHSGKTVFENDFSGSEWAGLMPKGHVMLDNVLFAPLIIRGKAHGVIGFANKPGGFTEDDARIASAFAELAAIALLNSKVLESLQDSEERFRSVVQTATVAVVNIDEYGKIVFWNKAAESMFGYSVEEALGRLVTLIIPERLQNDHQRGVDRILSTGETKIIGKTIETIGLKKDGNELPVELSVSLWVSKDGRFFTGILHDITDRKLAEKEVLTAKETAETANRAKSDFLANMSHELRTPLNAIIGFSDMMYHGITGELTGKQLEFLKDIKDSGELLLSLINDILDLSKVEAGKIELEINEFSVKSLIGSSLIFFKEKAMKQGIKLLSEIAPDAGTIEADERRIKQVVVNLLSNAVKFTPEGGSVSVRARKIHDAGYMIQDKDEELINVHPESGIMHPDTDFIEISVEDTGIGIKPEDMDRLFQPFQQLEHTLTKKHEGTGLGLALSRRIIELHHGRIWVESEPGKGSRFIFMIPVKHQKKDIKYEEDTRC